MSTVAEFDVGVTAETAEATEGRGGAKIVVFNASLEGSAETRNVQASRIKFSVPLLMPNNPREWHTETGGD